MMNHHSLVGGFTSVIVYISVDELCRFGWSIHFSVLSTNANEVVVSGFCPVCIYQKRTSATVTGEALRSPSSIATYHEVCGEYCHPWSF